MLEYFFPLQGLTLKDCVLPDLLLSKQMTACRHCTARRQASTRLLKLVCPSISLMARSYAFCEHRTMQSCAQRNVPPGAYGGGASHPAAAEFRAMLQHNPGAPRPVDDSAERVLLHMCNLCHATGHSLLTSDSSLQTLFHIRGAECRPVRSIQYFSLDA